MDVRSADHFCCIIYVFVQLLRLLAAMDLLKIFSIFYYSCNNFTYMNNIFEEKVLSAKKFIRKQKLGMAILNNMIYRNPAGGNMENEKI